VNNSTVATVGGGNTVTKSTDTDGYGNVSLTPEANGTVRVAASSGGSTVGYNVTFENVSATAKSQVKEVDGSASDSGSSGKAEFDLTNDGSDPVELVAIAWNDTSSSATEISANGNNNPWFKTSSTDLDTGTLQLNNGRNDFDSSKTSTLASGETKTYEFDRFRDGDGQVDITGESVTITLYFDDGSEKTLTLNF